MADVPALWVFERREDAERERDRRVAIDVEIQPLAGRGYALRRERAALRLAVDGRWWKI